VQDAARRAVAQLAVLGAARAAPWDAVVRRLMARLAAGEAELPGAAARRCALRAAGRPPATAAPLRGANLSAAGWPAATLRSRLPLLSDELPGSIQQGRLKPVKGTFAGKPERSCKNGQIVLYTGWL